MQLDSLCDTAYTYRMARTTIQTYIDVDRETYRKLGAIARMQDTTIAKLLGQAAKKIVEDYQEQIGTEQKKEYQPY